MRRGNLGLLFAVVVLLTPGPARAAEAPAVALDQPPAPGRMLLVDESRQKVHFVDLKDAAKHWEIEFPKRYRDIQVLPGRRLLASTDAGFREYDLDTRKMLVEHRDAALDGTNAVRRLGDGRTIVGRNAAKAIEFVELDRQNKVLRTAKFEGLNTLRLFRMSSRGTLLFGCNKTLIVEADLDGKLLRKIEIPDGGHFYHVLELESGHLLASAGYSCFVVELDKAGKEVRRWGGKALPKELGCHFFAGLHPLPDGGFLVANWTGHGAQDSAKGHQVLRFSADGKVTWSWHDPKLTGSVNGVILMGE